MESVTVARGRPREFDVEEALAAALRVFWEKGYEGASLTDLTDAMRITRPSLYAAFGNKEALFKRALDLYETEKLAYVRRALDAPTACLSSFRSTLYDAGRTNMVIRSSNLAITAFAIAFPGI